MRAGQVDAKILYSSRSGLGHPTYYQSVEFELRAPAWFAISASILQVRSMPHSAARGCAAEQERADGPRCLCGQTVYNKYSFGGWSVDHERLYASADSMV